MALLDVRQDVLAAWRREISPLPRVAVAAWFPWRHDGCDPPTHAEARPLQNGLGLDSCAIFVVRSRSAGDAEVTPKVNAEDIEKVLIKPPHDPSWNETVSRGEPHIKPWTVGAMPQHYVNRFQTFTGQHGFPGFPERHYRFDRNSLTLKEKLQEFLEPAMTEEQINTAWWVEQDQYDKCKEYIKCCNANLWARYELTTATNIRTSPPFTTMRRRLIPEVAPIKVPYLRVKEIRMSMRDWVCDDGAAGGDAHFPLMVKICNNKNRSVRREEERKAAGRHRNNSHKKRFTSVQHWAPTCWICGGLHGPQRCPRDQHKPYLRCEKKWACWTCKQPGHTAKECQAFHAEQRAAKLCYGGEAFHQRDTATWTTTWDEYESAWRFEHPRHLLQRANFYPYDRPSHLVLRRVQARW